MLSFLFSFNTITQNTNISKNSGTQIRSSSTILPFIVGVKYGPIDLDPIHAWDTASIDVIDQVIEGLFAYNLSDPDLALIPRLASALGTWNAGTDEYTVPLRTGVKFHDGTDFNAAAVVAHWDRMAWALNTTGTNTVRVTQVESLYKFPNGIPIVNNVTDNADNTVTFFLNGPYVPFASLLCFSASYIQSPTYITSLSNTYINTASGDIVGTGPFVYDSYEAGVEVLFHAFDDYWKGKANITELVFSEIVDDNARNNALLSGDIHFLSNPSATMLDTFKTNPNITVLDTGKKSAVTSYLGMNNNLINRTFREAISYSINYSYILDVLRSGTADRMRSPIPEGILFSNTTFNVPILNLTHARLVMQSMGFGVGFNISDDTEWINQNATSPFAIFNYTYNIGNSFREDVLVLLQYNLAKIGIAVTDAGGTWGDFVYSLLERNGRHRNQLELYFLGWGPDYNDPSNFINPLFTNRSIASNGVQYNGYLAAIEDGRDPFALNDNVQLLMEAAIIETNSVQREQIYDRIQELLIERDFSWALGYVPKLYHAHHVNLTGFQQNSLNKLDFFSCNWEYYTPVIIPTVDSLSITIPDATSSWEIDTIHSLTWTSIVSIVNVRIELYWMGTLNATISASTPNDGSYSWTIPTALANSTFYQIKISDVANLTIYDYSDNFEIYTMPTLPPVLVVDSITVTNPSGIVAWEINTVHTLTWTSTGSISNVQIELYISGVLDSVLTSGTPNDGELSWTIPSGLANSTFYQIKISDVANLSTYDYSDYFAIYDPAIAGEEIPGYNLYFLLMILGIVSAVLIKKKHKHFKK